METISFVLISLSQSLNLHSFPTQAIISLRSLFSSTPLLFTHTHRSICFTKDMILKMETLSRFLVFMSLFSGLVSGFALQNLPIQSFEEGYTQLFGDKNLFVHKDGKSVRLTLDERTGTVLNVPLFFFISRSFFSGLVMILIFAGSGFVSNDLYLHGFFSASIKLPSDYSAGVVVAFYVS